MPIGWKGGEWPWEIKFRRQVFRPESECTMLTPRLYFFFFCMIGTFGENNAPSSSTRNASLVVTSKMFISENNSANKWRQT